MRSILEKALIALLNEEREKADALFHDFILERSRQIHESLRQGEDFVLDESWENDLALDEMFTEDDLMGEDDEAEGGDDVVAEDEGDEMDADAVADADDAAADDASDDSALDSEEDSEEDAEEDADAFGAEEDEDIETRVDDLEAELTRLAAEFDALVSGEDETVDAVRGDLEGEEFGAEGGDEFGDDAVAGGEDAFGGDEEIADEGFDMFGEGKSYKRNEDDADKKKKQDKERKEARDEKKRDRADESVASELDKVKVDMAGKEQGGKSFTSNNKSPLLQPKLNDRALKGEPVQIKAKEHSGYEKEAAPGVVDQKLVKARNTKSKAADGRTKVSKEGDKSAELNDPKLSGTNEKSLIGSTKTPMGKN